MIAGRRSWSLGAMLTRPNCVVVSMRVCSMTRSWPSALWGWQQFPDDLVPWLADEEEGELEQVADEALG